MSCPVMHSNRQSRVNSDSDKNVSELEDNYSEKLPALPLGHTETNGGSIIAKMVISEEYKDEKEQRLAEFVAKMDQNRHTSGVEGFKNSQRQQAEALFQELLIYTRQV